MKQSHRPAVIASWLYSYNKEWLRPDILAGLTTAAVVIPKAMAYATIAGLPVEVGLYTAFLPMVIYAVFGTSRPLSVSTTTTLAILAAAELGRVVPSGDPSGLLRAAVTLTLLVGGILVLASVLRLGFIANFISEPVLVGFKAGIGVVIVAGPGSEAAWHAHSSRRVPPKHFGDIAKRAPCLAANSCRRPGNDRVTHWCRAIRAEFTRATYCGCCRNRCRWATRAAVPRRRAGREDSTRVAVDHHA